MEQLKQYLRQLIDGTMKVQEGQTHCMEILTLMKDGLGEFLIRTEETHYLVDGLASQIKFADGKTYEITIKEKR